MSAPFAALEARVNSAVIAHLANATADFGGGKVVDVEFKAPYDEALGIVAGSSPAIRAIASDISSVVPGAAVTIAGNSYRVVAVEPNDGGMTWLRLEDAS